MLGKVSLKGAGVDGMCPVADRERQANKSANGLQTGGPQADQALRVRSYFIGVCWSGRRDLNSRPPVPQTGALTGLRHAPTGTARTIGPGQRLR